MLGAWLRRRWTGCRAVRGWPPATPNGRRPPRCASMVACLWADVVPDGPERKALILPDACSDLIWQQGAGALGRRARHRPGDHDHPGGHGHGRRPLPPGGGGPVLGLPLSELRDLRVDLAEVLPAGRAGAPRDADPGRCRRPPLDLAGLLVADGAPDPPSPGGDAAGRPAPPAPRQVAGRGGPQRCASSAGAFTPPSATARRPCSASAASSASSACSTRPAVLRPGAAPPPSRLRRPVAPDPRVRRPVRPHPGRPAPPAPPGLGGWASVPARLDRVSLGSLGVGPAGRRGPLMPAGSGLGDVPSR